MAVQKMKTLDDIKGNLSPFLVPVQGRSERTPQCLPQVTTLQFVSHNQQDNEELQRQLRLAIANKFVNFLT